jgi:helix-turn-helix protein
VLVNELQELINTAIKEGKSLEEVEKQTGMLLKQDGDPDEHKKAMGRSKKTT